VGAHISLCFFNRHRSRQSRRRGLLYHETGLGVARDDDADVNGLVGDARLADVRLAFCVRNLVAMAAWNELTHQKPAFLVAVRRGLQST